MAHIVTAVCRELKSCTHTY